MSLRADGDTRTVATDLRLEGSAKVGTAPSATGVIPLHTGVVSMLCHKVSVDFNAASAAATTKDVTLWSPPAGFIVKRVLAKVNTTFNGGAVSDCDVTVGRSAGGAEYLASFDVDTAAVLAGGVIAEVGTQLKDATLADVEISANAFVASTIQCRFTSVGANLNALTSGQMDVYIIGLQLPLVAS